MSTTDVDIGRRKIQRVIQALEAIDNAVFEAVETVSAQGQLATTSHVDHIEIIRSSYNVYRPDYTQESMVQYLRGSIPAMKPEFDALVTFTIRNLSVSYRMDPLPWQDWRDRALALGNTAWRDAIPASGTIVKALPNLQIASETINKLGDKFSILDRLIDHLDRLLERPLRTVKLSEDYQDTLSALVEMSRRVGPYAPTDWPTIEVYRSEIRRRRPPRPNVDQPTPNMPLVPDSIASPAQAQQIATAASIDSSITQTDTRATGDQRRVTVSTATVAVLFAVIISAIPGYKAWQYSPREPGSTTDSDYWFLIQGSLMQGVGLMTIILPLAAKGALRFRPWFWMWMLIFISTACAIVSVVLYDRVPTEWSATIAFLGSAAQAFVTLQAMLLEGPEKVKTQ